MHTSRTSRRSFLRSSSLLAAGMVGVPYLARAQDQGQKVKMAVIGAGGQGGSGMATAMGEQLVAVVDVDLANRAAKAVADAKAKFPDLKTYSDYRQMFDAHPDLDAVWIATPDHNHFPASVRALSAGIAVYCEKPLTHNIWEARKLRELAAAKGVPTQMGNQGHASETIRLICEYIRSGALGEVTTVHCVSNRTFSAAPPRPAAKPIPAGLDWEAWLGPAPYRELHDGLHPFSWRGWLDFGTASIGDMACHTMDGAVWGLKLDQAETVEVLAEDGGVNSEGFTPNARIVFQFPARGDLKPVTLTWWNGGGKNLPPRPPMLEADREQLGEGTYYYGSKAVMQSGSHCQGTRIIPETQHQQTPKPEPTMARVPGHAQDFLRACRDRTAPAPSSNFAYSARLTEIVLLGAVALRCPGEKLVYDMKVGRVTNHEPANAFLRREPRAGWEFGYTA